jgi:hypothetical protein
MPKITFRGKTYYSEFEMPPNIRRAYQTEQSNSSPSRKELPTTDELYRQSAPSDMKHLPSDESSYQPSAPIVDPQYSTIEPESSYVIRGLIFGILWSLVMIAIVFLVIEFLRQVL